MQNKPKNKPKPTKESKKMPTLLTGLYKAFKSVDTFAETFTLQYPQNQEKLYTAKGALLTIIAYACLGYFSYIFYTKYTDKTNVETSISREVHELAPEMKILESGFYPIFTFMREPGINLKPSDIPKYYSIKGQVGKLDLVVDPATGARTDLEVSEVLSFGFIPCSETDSEYKNRLLAQNKIATDLVNLYGICPVITNPDLFYLGGSLYVPPRVRISIKFFPCELQTGCRPFEDLTKTSLVLTFPKISFNPENEFTPVKIIPEVSSFEYIDPDFKTNYDIMIKKSEIWDEKSFLGSAEKHSDFYSIESRAQTKRTVQRNGVYRCLPNSPICRQYYFNVLIKGSDTLEKITRIYPNLLSMLGDLGGLFDLTLIFLSLFYTISSFFSCSRGFVETVVLDKKELMSGEVKKGLERLVEAGEVENKNFDNFDGGRGSDSVGDARGGGVGVDGTAEGVGSKKAWVDQERLVEGVFGQVLDAFDLLRTKNEAKALIEAFLGEEERRLIPVLLLVWQLRKTRKGANSCEKNRGNGKNSKIGRIQPKTENEGFGQNQGSVSSQKVDFPQEMSFEQAYTRLKFKKPKNEVEKVIQNFFLTEIPETFFSPQNVQRLIKEVQMSAQFPSSLPRKQLKTDMDHPLRFSQNSLRGHLNDSNSELMSPKKLTDDDAKRLGEGKGQIALSQRRARFIGTGVCREAGLQHCID